MAERKFGAVLHHRPSFFVSYASQWPNNIQGKIGPPKGPNFDMNAATKGRQYAIHERRVGGGHARGGRGRQMPGRAGHAWACAWICPAPPGMPSPERPGRGARGASKRHGKIRVGGGHARGGRGRQMPGGAGHAWVCAWICPAQARHADPRTTRARCARGEQGAKCIMGRNLSRPAAWHASGY